MTKKALLSERLQTICGPSWLSVMPRVTDTQLGEISHREATFEISWDWPFDDGRSALLYMVKHFEKHGGDGLSWLASWSRQKEISEHEPNRD